MNSGLSGPALGCFLLICSTIAYGCNSTSARKSNSAELRNDMAASSQGEDVSVAEKAKQSAIETTKTDEPESPWDEDCSLVPKSTLRATLEKSNIPETDKRALCDCFEELTPRWNRNLENLFRRGNAREIAKTLEQLIECCDETPRDMDANCKAVKQKFIKKTVITSVPLYKGVAFVTK